MKEGLVIEISKKYVIILSNNGEFLKLEKNKKAVIGEVYRAPEYKKFKPSIFQAAAAIVIFALTSFAGYNAYASQIVGVVDITGDKPIKLFINRSGYVQRVEGVDNPDNFKKIPVVKAVENLTKSENPQINFTDPSKVNASATKLKNSKIDFNKLNKKLQKTLDEKKEKYKKENKGKENKKKNKPDKNTKKYNNTNNGANQDKGKANGLKKKEFPKLNQKKSESLKEDYSNNPSKKNNNNSKGKFNSK